ncbi:ABC transporter substrate-binding protein [Paractinoplanes hotanensis]|uniref:ABC transporter substrate-binding protein n=1 Tax=Paractinoplanes hotanensis TaxID=2906497 RepID=A0ABT0XX65_9ACTN|nr:ABC transporter substrate-binding protein [Actinoplanes hotanensis]MCM4078385.1 ABC transporter substrate-binding protein [Actinoplanes hotanensis]
MARRFNVAIAATAALALGVTGCSSPSSNNDTEGSGDSNKITTQVNATDPNAKGPAKEIEGARPGGVLNVVAQTTPNTFDPTDIYYVDSNEIGKTLFRTPTQFDIRDGKAVLVPDLTDLGTPSADNLTWTFKMQPNIKYEDGTPVKIEDLAYAIKRSFAHDVFVNGPTYQLQYFKDGDKYKGPYKDGDNYAGVETQGTDTLIIHLAKQFSDLPFYMTFPMFTPIPKEKDTRQDYKNKPLATGPYKFKTYQAGTSLVLEKNTNWDPNTDPVRHQYLDGFNFQWGGDAIKSQQAVLNSNGQDANSINYDELDASLIPQLTGEKREQLVQGQSSCTIVWQLDTRKIPLEVRKAVAKAYPYDQLYKAAGLNDYVAEAASTVMPPSVQGYEKYTPVADLAGSGAGDPAAAKAMLEAAGKAGFELSYYFDNTKPLTQQVSQIRADALTKAGFKVKPIGVSTADLRSKKGDYDAPVNMGQSPAGWCSDWPTGGSWFPVLFQTHSISDGQSWGMLSDKALDAEIDSIANLPAEESTAKWAALDKKVMELYVALPTYYDKLAVVKGTNVGTTAGDPTMGMPLFVNMYLKS